MDVIFKILLHIFQWQKCDPVIHNIMGYHNGNVYYAVLINSGVLVYLVWSQIKMQQTRVQQYIFLFTALYHDVPFMAYAYMKIEKRFLYVPLILVL